MESNIYDNIVSKISSILKKQDIQEIREIADQILLQVESLPDDSELKYIREDVLKIRESLSQERAVHYARIALKSLSGPKRGKINDMDMNRWREYEDIITDSLWIIKKRDRSGAHNADYWGNFIPQIPYQMINRYTKKNEWVLDTFAGSGTTLIECRRNGRNGIGIDISPNAVETSEKNIENEENRFNVKTRVIKGNSIKIDYKRIMEENGIEKFQLAILHPPYWDIIKFSDDTEDLSNMPSTKEFLKSMRILGEKVYDVLEDGRMAVLVIGDKYSGGEWIPLGFLTMNELMASGFNLKSIVVKNYDLTRGKSNQEELWRYRALMGNFYVFKHEYIFIMEKKKGRRYKKTEKE